MTRAVRVVLVAVGAAVVGYGGWLLVPTLYIGTRYLLTQAAWLFGGPVLHDALAAPALAGVGVAVSRLVPARARTAVVVGLAATGTLVLLAVPLVWRPYRAGANPGLQDRSYLPGLVVFLLALWALVAVVALAARRWRARKRLS